MFRDAQRSNLGTNGGAEKGLPHVKDDKVLHD